MGSNPILSAKTQSYQGFCHMTGLFFSLKVTSAYMIFGKTQVCQPVCLVSGRVRILSITFAEVILDL